MRMTDRNQWPDQQDEDFKAEVARLLREYRTRRGLTQAVAALRGGTTDKSLSLYENSMRAIPLSTWTRLAEVLRIPKREWPTHAKPSTSKPFNGPGPKAPSKTGRSLTASSR
jgi:transcriptional regulator with XRE-family HTH domain